MYDTKLHMVRLQLQRSGECRIISSLLFLFPGLLRSETIVPIRIRPVGKLSVFGRIGFSFVYIFNCIILYGLNVKIWFISKH